MHRFPLNSGSNRTSPMSRMMALGLIGALLQPLWPNLPAGASTPTPAKGVAAGRKGPASEEAAVHLLSRLTYGPTPDAIAEVKRLGVDGWLNEQLHPERIADGALEARLDEFPALRLPVDTLLERFPNGATIRQTANGKLALPGDPGLRAIYQRQIALYQGKQAAKAEQDSKGAVPVSMSMQGDSTAAAMGAMNGGVGKKPAKGETAKPADGKAAKDDAVNSAQDALLAKTVLALKPEQRVRRVMGMKPEEYDRLRAAMNGQQKQQLVADLTPEERELLADFDNPAHAVVEEEQAQRLLRAIYSSRQLQEVMTGFWLNHFNVYLHKNEQEPYYLVSYERDVIRPHALGNFEDLLIATAESPAMLLYLDNAESTGPDSAAAEKQKAREAAGKAVRKNAPQGLNENYARELMELHTLGVNGGYTQKDVTEVAKVFTGWTVAKPGQGGGFEFDATRHEPGVKHVRGRTIREDGQREGLDVLHMLGTSPATAHFLSQELAIAFVSDAPPAALVNRMAKSFLTSDGNIAAVLKTMVYAPEFWSKEALQAKIKTPFEYVVSAARASGAEVTNTPPLVNALNQMGMPLYACVPPTGYPAKAADWVSTGALVTRMNFALSLATNHYPGIKTEWDNSEVTPELFEKTLEARLLPLGVSEKTRMAVLEQAPAAAAKAPVAADWRDAQIAGLLLGSPEFQRR